MVLQINEKSEGATAVKQECYGASGFLSFSYSSVAKYNTDLSHDAKENSRCTFKFFDLKLYSLKYRD